MGQSPLPKNAEPQAPTVRALECASLPKNGRARSPIPASMQQIYHESIKELIDGLSLRG
jgi:hypothetical protein